MEIQHYIHIDGRPVRIKDRVAAGLLALFTGWFGLHRFYMGAIGWGIIYVVFSWTAIPFIAGIVESIMYFVMTDEEFDVKYNGGR